MSQRTQTAEELVEELREILTCRNATKEQIWRAYRAVARWRPSLALLGKHDFCAMLAAMRATTINRRKDPIAGQAAELARREEELTARLERATGGRSSCEDRVNVAHRQAAHGQLVVNRMRAIVRDMRVMKQRLPGHEYAALISIYTQHCQPAAAEALFAECRSELSPGPLPSCVYEAMMRAYLGTRQAKKALALFNEAVRVGRSPSRSMCNMALHAHLQCGDLVRANILFESMQRGMLPSTPVAQQSPWSQKEAGGDATVAPTRRHSADIVTYNTMLTGHIMAQRMDRAAELVKRMEHAGPPPSRHTYRLLMRGYVNASDTRGLMDTWHRLAARDHGVDEVACKIALRLLERRMSPVTAVRQLFQQMPLASGDDHLAGNKRAVSWDALVRRMMMRALVREKRPRHLAASDLADRRDEFLAKYRDAITAQDPTTPGFVKAVLRGLARFNGDSDKVGMLLQQMDHSGIVMAETTWIRLLRYVRGHSEEQTATGKAGANLDVYSVLEALWASGTRLGVASYNLTLDVALAANDSARGSLSDAAKIKSSVLDAMQQAGITPNAATFATLAAWSSDSRELDALLASLWRTDGRGAPGQLDIFAHAYNRLGDLPTAYQLFRQARAAGITTPYLYGMLMQAYRNAGSVRAVRRVHRLLALDRRAPDLIAYTILTDVLARFGQPAAADRVLGEVRAVGLRPDLPLYTALLRGTFRLGDLGAVKRLLTLVAQDGYQLDARLATTLLAGYSRFGTTAGIAAALSTFDQLYTYAATDRATVKCAPAAANRRTWNALLSGIGRQPGMTHVLDRLLGSMMVGEHCNTLGRMPALSEDAAEAAVDAANTFSVPADNITADTIVWKRDAVPAPDTRSFKIVIGAHLRHRQWEAVHAWWQRWRTFLNNATPAMAASARPDAVAYAMVTQAYYDAGQLRAADQLAQEAAALGLLPASSSAAATAAATATFPSAHTRHPRSALSLSSAAATSAPSSVSG
ncbi:hypothetical protein THASP1DRAFT_31811 [Thamnocephalis sphaerospora]|uniref:Pentacotripeptide-repeat region of PRORP domain-containing protein n=1 Tax=Thamnocephalis sphaerospora TaxID=78915 RepID=A0A4P9XKN9_9FUNG|nr:hypothetical protein THASP1DRAFT_31811 [Thamnocephalis sphaerospora]|eukprot:RKP06367.1 hypothetical protein THASP1DRAFT_31811 [Thamnocephalis sphaerospora]